MKMFVDGDQVVVTRDNFINLQESPAVFFDKDSEEGKTIIEGGIGNLPFGLVREIVTLLKYQEQKHQRNTK